jgi:enamine deaminase RidA (YjgF/YER057c/UK114 family)
MTWYLVDVDEYNSSLQHLGKIYQEEIGKVFPAMTGIQVAGLVEKGAKLEIEVTAVIPDRV